MKKLVIISFCFILHCCSTSNQGLSSLAMSDCNVNRMSQLSVGMCQQEVINLLRKPYSYECFMIDDDIYDVWFYVVHPTVLGQSRMVHQNLTPLTFKNGELIGWGYRYYYYYQKSYLHPPKKNVEKSETSPGEPPSQTEPPETEHEDEDLGPQLTMSYRVKKADPSDEKDEDDEPPPDEEGREMIQDDAEDDFDQW